MKDRIAQSQALRASILCHLYQLRIEKPADHWQWRRSLEEVAGGPVAFELDYLVERGDVEQNGLRYRITAQGIDHCERHCLQGSD